MIDKFVWVDSSYNFKLECESNEVCDKQNKANRLVIAMGLVASNPQFFGYISYGLKSNGVLEPITDENELMFGYKLNGSLYTGPGKALYISSVFVPHKNQLIQCIAYTFKNHSLNNVRHETIRRKVKLDDDWTVELINNNEYKGMFTIDRQVFAVDKNNIVHEIYWDIFGVLSIRVFVCFFIDYQWICIKQ